MAKRIVTLEVHNDLEARELNLAWEEIVTGKKITYAAALEHAQETIMERARVALERIETAIDAHPTSGQARRLVRFLAGIYNGSDYSFDLTDLRTLDTDLANACLDYLSYDRLAKQEVHHHLTGGDRALHGWLESYGIKPELRLSSRQGEAFAEIAKNSGRERAELFDEAVGDLIEKYRRKRSASRP